MSGAARPLPSPFRQQLASTPNYFRASSATTVFPKEGFDPLAAGAALGRVQTSEQLEYLTPASGVMTEFLRTHRHDFTPVARSVLANTRTDAHRGLMRDLSLKPDVLGAAFAAHANYPAYTETPGVTLENTAPAYPEISDVDSPPDAPTVSGWRPRVGKGADPLQAAG